MKEEKTNLPAYIQQSMQSIEGMMEYANVILKSKLCPQHFYEKDDKGKPDYTRGKPEAVLIVLQHGLEIGLSVSQSLQQVVPVNGLISIKGIGAKSLIFRSGILEPGSWKEEESGSIETEDYTFKITSTRSDSKITHTTKFSVSDAKRAGLWIGKDRLGGNDGWKYKQSAWVKYPGRMVQMRCLGFHARDNFPDILAGMYTLEEAQDMPQDTEVVVETTSGAKIVIPDKEFAEERSETLTGKLAAKLSGKDIHLQQREQEQLADLQEETHVYTEEELVKMGQGIFSKVKKEFPELNDLLEKLPMKKTRDRWRKGVISWQDNTFDDYYSEETKLDVEPEKKPADQLAFEKNIETEQPVQEETKSGIEHEGVHITSLPESGARSFDSKRKIFIGLTKLGLTPEKYSKVADKLVDEQSGETYLSKYENMDQFSKRGEVEHVTKLVNVLISGND